MHKKVNPTYLEKYYGVFDKVAGVVVQKFVSFNEQSAIRSFDDALVHDDLPYNKSPDDYSLMYMYTLDCSTGEVTDNEYCIIDVTKKESL